MPENTQTAPPAEPIAAPAETPAAPYSETFGHIAVPDPFNQPRSVPITNDAPHDGPAYRAAIDERNAVAVAALQSALEGLKTQRDNLKPVPGSQATGMALSSLNLLISEAQRHFEHLQRVITP